MRFVDDFAVKNNYSCIRFDAYSENLPALSLYESMGYKRLGNLFFPVKESPFYCFEKVME